MNLKYYLSIFVIGLSLTGLFAQSGHHCSRVKGQGHSDSRSARLSDHNIALTQKYDVHFYHLDLEVERTSTDIEGAVQIHVEVVAPVLDTFLFELFEDLWIDDVLMNGTTPIPFVREESAVIVPVDFEAGDDFFVEVIYSGTPPDGEGPLGGGGMSNDSSPSWGNQVTWSLSEPFAAYEWFPCKQLLTDKADSVYVFVTTDESNMAGSNGLLTDVVDLPGGKQRYEWKSNYPIAYYLISIAVAEYVEYTIYADPAGAPEPIMIQNFIYNNPSCLPFFEDDIDETADYLEYYSEVYGLYPFHTEKYGHCMAPLSGGMEHQTMTTQGYFVNWLTAHELGHQWFGDNVTCASWSDIWLNEGFASYSEELMYAEFYPGEEVLSMQERHLNIMDEPNGSVWVEDSLDFGRIFSGRLTYDKGAAIVHTLRFLIDNDEQFFEILQTYQETYTDGTARLGNFQEIAENISGLDFDAFFEEWYYGEGFPTYELEYAWADGSGIVVLEQDVSWPPVTSLFTNDLEIRVVGEEGYVEVIRLSGIDDESTVHNFSFPESIASITVDPNNWIINQFDGATENNILTDIQQFSNELEIYPNPATDFLVLVNESNASTYVILDASGKQIVKGKLANGKNSIDLNGLSSGQYFILVDGSRKAFSKL